MPSLVPRPQSMVEMSGASLTLRPDASIQFEGDTAGRDVAELLAGYLRAGTGFPWPVNPTGAEQPTIVLRVRSKAILDAAGFADESYRLTSKPSGIVVEAETDHGLARGIQTVRQLFDPALLAVDPPRAEKGREWTIPSVAIEDRPRYRWRGIHLDIARHFFTADQICRFIDALALHKINILHLHLTDDQGWRLEIERYPRLTEIGARRDGTLVGRDWDRPRRYDGHPYGGFLTRQDVKRIVAHAAVRRMTVVPEIDMPGHMQAAIAAYPELGNTDMTLRPRCHWGISQHILNLRPATIEFMKNVLGEVIDLFPARFIHVGGDEALKHEWAESPEAQQRMAELGLRSENELQSWFIAQMSEVITAAGRRLIGWDEIHEGGLAPGAAVTFWHGGGKEGLDLAVEIARSGHDVVMAPAQQTYFDYYQADPIREEPLAIGGMLPTGKVYAFDPMPPALAGAAERQHIIGGQGQLWTEYIPTFEHLQYMAFPRACALAEALWLDEGEKDFRRFLAALAPHRRRLQAMGMNSHPRP